MTKHCYLLTLIGIFIVFTPVQADIAWDAAVSGGYTDNLLNESSGVEDSWSTYQGSLHLYPLATVALDLRGEYTYYGNTHDLSNYLGGANLVWIPTPETSPLSIYFEAGFDSRHYRDRFEDFDNNVATARASVAREIGSRVQVRSGLLANVTAYPHDDTTTNSDYRQAELYAGLNISLPYNHSFDIETGYGITGFWHINAAVDSVISTPFEPFGNPADFLREGDFTSFYISPRISRSLGARTGVSLTYTYRKFYDVENSVVLGYSTDFLSPWASFFDGSSVTMRLKSYLVPNMIITTGVGYWNKTYLRALEIVEKELIPGYFLSGYDEPKNAKARDDDMSRVYLSLQRPFLFGKTVVEPILSIDYINNRSSSDSYDYSGTAVMLGISVRP